MNLILSPKGASWLAVTLAVLMTAIVLFGALREPRHGYTRDATIEPCALVLTQSGQECR